MDAPPEHICSANGGNCQFAPQAKAQFNHGGARFCLLHLPLEAERKRPDDFMVLLSQSLAARKNDLSEVQFPSTSTVNLEHANDMVLERCVFGEILLNLRNARIASCEVKGPISVIARGKLEVEDTDFPSTVTLTSEGSKSIVFRKVRFLGKVKLAHPVSGAWTFDRTQFLGPLLIHQKTTELPQQITFGRVQFRRQACGPGTDGNYRQWRTLFAENSDRENEGLFYALEKRSHRRGLPWYSLSRAVSAIYDGVSMYGQSYERAFGAFLALQLIAGLGYATALGMVHWLQPIDGNSLKQIVAFTIAQVAKPFELMSGRQPDHNSVLALVADGRASWAIWTFVHSALSIIFLALMVLAFRWRFRRA